MIPVRVETYYTYVLRNMTNGEWYTGCMNDLKHRLREHKDHLRGYTKHNGPYEMIYQETCFDKKDAYAREKYLKTGMGKRYIRNRLQHYFSTLTG